MMLIRIIFRRIVIDKVNRLLVYFSYTGNTGIIVNMIKDRLNCDVLEIKTVLPYSSVYDDVVNDYRNGEYNDYLLEIQEFSIDLNAYDEIILGTPVWWYRPAPAIRSFLSCNDLSFKRIVPFATNAGWIGKTFDEIMELCPNSDVACGMNIVFEAHSSKLVTDEEKIYRWIDCIN